MYNYLNLEIMKITEKTYVADILKEYGDIASIMEIFGVKRVGSYGFRKFLTRFITVKTAAFVHTGAQPSQANLSCVPRFI